MYKINLLIIAMGLLFWQGCNKPEPKVNAYYKEKMEAVIWDNVPYHTKQYAQKEIKLKTKLDKSIFGLNVRKIKHLTKQLNQTTDHLTNVSPSVKVYYGFDTKGTSLLSNKVDDIIVTYVDDRLAHVYMSFRKTKKKNNLSEAQLKNAVIKQYGFYNEYMKDVYINTVLNEEPLGDIKDTLTKKFGEAFYYDTAEANSDSNAVYTWGMRRGLYYRVVVNKDDKYGYLSIKSKAFMNLSKEEIINVQKIQNKRKSSPEISVTMDKKG